MDGIEQQPGSEDLQRLLGTTLNLLGYSGDFVIKPADAPPSTSPSEIAIPLEALGDESYKPQWRVLALAHEIEAHYAPARREPDVAAKEQVWSQEHPAAEFFLHVMADITGNRHISTKIPTTSQHWEDLYATKLMPETDYRVDAEGRPRPRHVQFMQAMVRETFVPDQICEVAPEVRDRLGALHDFKGSGQDLIAYATQPFKTPTTYLSRTEQMQLWERGIWPAYLELYEQDLQAMQPSASSDRPDDASGEGEDGLSDTAEQSFDDSYSEYEQQQEPSNTTTLDSDTRENLDAALKDIVNDDSDQAFQDQEAKALAIQEDIMSGRDPDKIPSTPEENYKRYTSDLFEVRPIIDELYKVFKSRLTANESPKRQPRGRQLEGPRLDRRHLGSTMATLMGRGSLDNVPAYEAHRPIESQNESLGYQDFWLIADTSQSMARSHKNEYAAKLEVVYLEAIDMLNEILAEYPGTDSSPDRLARSGIITFAKAFTVVKPLGTDLSLTERTEAHASILEAWGRPTHISPALTHVFDYYQDNPTPDREKTIVLLTDDQQSWSEVSGVTLQLRAAGITVIPLYVLCGGADPEGRRIDDVRELPGVMGELLKDTVAA